MHVEHDKNKTERGTDHSSLNIQSNHITRPIEK